MKLYLQITNELVGNRLITQVDDQFGNPVYGIDAIYKLTDLVSAFTDDYPDQEQIEDLITALEESLRIACAYKVKELP